MLLFLFNTSYFFGVPYFQEPQQIRTFDDDFKSRYSSRKYNYQGKKIISKTPSHSGKFKDYKNDEAPDLKEHNNFNSFSLDLGPLVWFFYLALFIALIFILYILFKDGSSSLFSTKQNKNLNIYDNITADNIKNTDINILIQNAEKQNDFRLAIRYYYLLVLKHLSLKNYIQFEEDKTNSEYLNEIRDKSFSKPFAYSSYLYNYIWYGEFSLNLEEYNKAKGNFKNLLKQLNS